MAIDSAGGVYIADTDNWRVRRVGQPFGIISSIAGNGTYGAAGDGNPAISASFSDVTDIALDAANNLYVADASNHRIRKVTPGGMVTTIAGTGVQGSSGDGGLAVNATLNRPISVTFDAAGNNLYICDSSNHNIRRVSLASGIITTYAGNGVEAFSGDGGPATAASLTFPLGLAMDKSGNLYIADAGNNRIRRVSPFGLITTVAGNRAGFAGDGAAAASALLKTPSDVAVDGSGSLLIADSGNNRVRKVDGTSGIMSTIAGGDSDAFSGDNGPAANSLLSFPWKIAIDAAGSIYIADRVNNRVRKISGSPLPPPTSPAMSISKGGIVPVGGTSSAIQPGSWVSIYGTNLANGTSVWNSDFPTSLGGVTVTINNRPGYLWFVSPTQINLQAPDDSALGPVNVTVTKAGTPSVTATVTLAQTSPAFLLLSDARHATGLIMSANGSGSQGGGTYDFAGPASMGAGSRPVRPGEPMVLYGIGFGPTSPPVSAGKPYTCPPSGCAVMVAKPQVLLGGIPVQLDFAGMVSAGLYQFNFNVPVNLGSGDQALQALVNGVPTGGNVFIAVQ